MYLLSKLPPASQNFISGLISGGQTRTKAFEIAVSYTLSRQLPIPVESVKDIDQYYTLQLEQSVFKVLSGMNELMPFDTRSVRALLRNFYKFRYQSAFPKAIPIALRQDYGVEDFFQITPFFDKDTLDCLRADPVRVVAIINNLSALIEILGLMEAKKNQGADSVVEQSTFVPE